MVRHSVQSSNPANDSDLADLLGNDENAGSNGSNGVDLRKPGNIEMAALNLDHLTQGKLDVSNGSSRPFRSVRQLPLFHYLSSYVSMLCYYYPGMCGVFTVVTIASIMVMLGNLVLNPTEEFGVIKHDHSNIQSKYDLTMGEIDHWCLGGGDKGCACEDPLVPVSRAERKSWVQAFKGNRKLVKQYQDSPEGVADIDVAFVGESVVEEMAGRWMGQQRSVELKSVETMFRNNFDKKRSARFQGVALGIAGDSAPNVLWRLMHGEMPEFFNPKVWWVSLGNNDLGRMQCSEEVVVLGILRVVEEILEKKPDARVVINSLFPMAETRGGRYPLISDYKDSINQKGAASSRVVRRPNGANSNADPNAPRAMNGMNGMNGNFRPNAGGMMNNNNPGGRNPGTRRSLRFQAREYASPLPPRTPRKPQTEGDMAEAADAEEVARDKAYKKKHHMIRPNRADRPNRPAVLGDPRQHKIKKYNAQRAFLAKNRIPLWTAIEAINGQLRKFADSHDRVTFFDAKEVFTMTEARGGVSVLNKARMSVRGHPTELGYSAWEEAILKRLDKLFEVLKREQPELFSKKPTYVDDYGSLYGTSGNGSSSKEDDDDFDDSAFDQMYKYGEIGSVNFGSGGSTGNKGGKVDAFAFEGNPVGMQGGTGDGINSGNGGGTGLAPRPAAPPSGGGMYVQSGTRPGAIEAQYGALPIAPVVTNAMYGNPNGFAGVPGNTGQAAPVNAGSMYSPIAAAGGDMQQVKYDALAKADDDQGVGNGKVAVKGSDDDDQGDD